MFRARYSPLSLYIAAVLWVCSPSFGQAQELFLKCKVVFKIHDRSESGSPATHTYKINFLQKKIRSIPGGVPFDITFTNQEIKWHMGDIGSSFDYHIKRITGEISIDIFHSYSDGSTLTTFAEGSCEKASSIIEQPKF